MSEKTSTYQSPLCERYASEKMKYLFSSDSKIITWRRLMGVLVEVKKKLDKEKKIGEEIEQQEENIFNVFVSQKKRDRVSDVNLQAKLFSNLFPKEKRIIEWGAKSGYVVNNTEIMITRNALQHIKKQLLCLIESIANIAINHKDIKISHCDNLSSKLETLGEKEALWLQNFLEDFYNVEYLLSRMRLISCCGNTHISSDIIEVLDGDETAADVLDKFVAKELKFEKVCMISGRTYPKNMDVLVLNCLESITVNAMKMVRDIRFLEKNGEIKQTFEETDNDLTTKQSKKYPMDLELVAWIGRYVLNSSSNVLNAQAEQWFERNVDKTANTISSIPDNFLATDSIILLSKNLINCLTTNQEDNETVKEEDSKKVMRRCKDQITEFIENEVNPVLEANAELLTDMK